MIKYMHICCVPDSCSTQGLYRNWYQAKVKEVICVDISLILESQVSCMQLVFVLPSFKVGHCRRQTLDSQLDSGMDCRLECGLNFWPYSVHTISCATSGQRLNR